MATVARAATISGTIDLPAGVSPTGNLQVFVRLTDTARYDSGSPFNTTEDEGSAEELAGGSGHAGIDIRVGSTLPDVSPICFPVPAGTGGDGVICL